MLHDVCCDPATEETCYDDNYDPISCEAITDGGCPCPEGEEKCNADPENGNVGWCAKLCCDSETEEMCFDENYDPISCAAIADGGCPCPEGEERCGANEASGYLGYCAKVCCKDSEEICYDNYDPISCAAIADGGCPCPEGEEKCGADEASGWPGYCAKLCCDPATEETCYDENYDPISCSPIADGGCPCPEGEEKCGAFEGYAGWCTKLCCEDGEETCYDENYDPTSCAPIADGGCNCLLLDVCCDSDTEETCYDDNYNPISCAVIADGGCACPEGEEKCVVDYFGTAWPTPSPVVVDDAENYNTSKLIEVKGTPKEIAYFQDLKKKYQKVSAVEEGTAHMNSAKTALAQKMLAVVRTIKRREGMSNSDTVKMIETKGTAKEIAYYFQNLKKEQQKLSTDGGSHMKSVKVALEQKELALVRAIKLRGSLQEGIPFTKNEEISFM